MNENPQVNGGSRGAGSSVAMGFVLGALVGAGIALLLAPRSGRETRGRLADAGRRCRDEQRSRENSQKDE